MRQRIVTVILVGLLCAAMIVFRLSETGATQTVPTPAGQLGGAPPLATQPNQGNAPTPESTATGSVEERLAAVETRVAALEATVSALTDQ